METRNISLTPEEAKEWYNSNIILRDVALKAFTKEELENPSFKDIKTFQDACEALRLNYGSMLSIFNQLKSVSKASTAMYKLNIIRKALNLGQDLDLVKGSSIYYPYNPFITDNFNYYKDSDLKEMMTIGAIKNNEKTYRVLGNGSTIGSIKGLGSFYSNEGIGLASPSVAILGCATEEIAKHFGKYFGMLITEAKYGDLTDFEIINNN